MSYVFRSNSLLSSIAAIDFSQNLNLKVRIKSGNLPSFDRFYSINEFSKIYLNKLGIWENLETSKKIPYSEIEIYLNSTKSIVFKANDINISNLGYIVHEGDLVNAVSRCIDANLDIIKHVKNSYSDSNQDINILSNNQDIDVSQEFINYSKHDYNQTAINITFDHEVDNEKIPRQVFFKNEILGLLPTSNQSYNLIWSVPNKLHKEIENSSQIDIEEHLSERIGFITGKIKKIILGKSFQLLSRHADKYFHENNILIGEAAHKFHPLAGLGLNMGIEDISTLSYLLSQSNRSESVFYDYAIRRIYRNQALQKTLDFIINFHASESIPNKLKLVLLDRFNKTIFVKPKIIQNATGLINDDLLINNQVYSNYHKQ